MDGAIIGAIVGALAIQPAPVCRAIDAQGALVGVVAEVQIDKTTHIPSYCVTRMGCYAKKTGTCFIKRTPEYDFDNIQSWSVTP